MKITKTLVVYVQVMDMFMFMSKSLLAHWHISFMELCLLTASMGNLHWQACKSSKQKCHWCHLSCSRTHSDQRAPPPQLSIVNQIVLLGMHESHHEYPSLPHGSERWWSPCMMGCLRQETLPRQAYMTRAAVEHWGSVAGSVSPFLRGP